MNYLVSDAIPEEEGLFVGGVAKLKDIGLRPKKNGGMFGSGILKLIDGSDIPFKVWDVEASEEMLDCFKQSPKEIYLNISGKVDLFGGSKSLILASIEYLSKEKSKQIHEEYNVIPKEVNDERKRKFTKFRDILKENVSEKGYLLFSEIFKDNTLLTNFTVEFAGKSMHDAQFSGLLNHTLKMLELLNLVLEQQKDYIKLNQEGKDLIYIGLAIHDIGKTIELSEGVYTKESVATHRGLGILLISEHKDYIIKEYGMQFLLELIAIINQHHGLYEERPHSVFSYLIHLIDNFEASMTILAEKIPSAEKSESIKIFEYPDLRCDNNFFE